MRRSVAALAAVTLLLAGCRGGTGDSESGRPSAEGVLRVGLESPRSLDPAQANLPAELLVADQLFDGLTSYDPRTLEVRPGVAARWTASPDLRHWTFQVRPDARFTNGRPIESGDVKYTLERIAKKGADVASAAVAQLESVSGFRPYHDEAKRPGLDGVTTPARDLVRIDLDEPLSSLPAIFGNPVFGIVPRESVEAAPPADFRRAPVGSGPFRFESFDAGVLRLLPAPGSPAKIKALDFHLQRDVGGSYQAFTQGKLDWSTVPPPRVEEAAERYGRGGFGPYVLEVLYGFNLKNPKYADPRFREAIVRAIDREAVVKAVYGGTTLPLSGLVPAGLPGAQADPCGERCRFDPQRARSLVGQAFFGKPIPEVLIDHEDDPTQAAVARAIEANLRSVGIPARARSHPFAEYLTFATSGAQELFHFSSSGAYPSPDAFLTSLFLTGRPDNVIQYSVPQVDDLLKRARAEADAGRRMALYQEAERVIMSTLPVIPIAQYELHTVVAPAFRDLVLSPLGTFDAAQVRLEG